MKSPPSFERAIFVLYLGEKSETNMWAVTFIRPVFKVIRTCNIFKMHKEFLPRSAIEMSLIISFISGFTLR